MTEEFEKYKRESKQEFDQYKEKMGKIIDNLNNQIKELRNQSEKNKKVDANNLNANVESPSPGNNNYIQNEIKKDNKNNK